VMVLESGEGDGAREKCGEGCYSTVCPDGDHKYYLQVVYTVRSYAEYPTRCQSAPSHTRVV
jgi:hypothetical protein